MLLCFLNCLYIFQKIVFCEILCVKVCCVLTLWGHHTNIHAYYSSQHFRKCNISHFMKFCCCLICFLKCLCTFQNVVCCYILLYFDPLEPPYKHTDTHITVINILEGEDEVLSCLLNVVSWIVFAFSRMLCILKCCCVLTLGGHHTSTVINSTCVFRKRRCCNKLILRN